MAEEPADEKGSVELQDDGIDSLFEEAPDAAGLDSPLKPPLVEEMNKWVLQIIRPESMHSMIEAQAKMHIAVYM